MIRVYINRSGGFIWDHRNELDIVLLESKVLKGIIKEEFHDSRE